MNILIANASKFGSYKNAVKYASQDNAQGYGRRVFNGENNQFWVFSGADVRRALKAGYELTIV